ncbi:TRAP transporter substrate-binding protein DctP [Pseudooceanicola aestuarii]|uniref:TRAP transporter substrate-binding protein n=1 Tax=Pseudooceanicola aestuarii TaxID=2697319 RepID=UPI0013D35BE2|nr:TRAP transporter substrate-binding protein DctP [Pseudooceanicola aestuarii]
MTFLTTLKSTALAGALTVSLSAMATIAAAQDSVTLKLADQFPLTHIGSRVGAQALIAELEARSDGAIQIRHFPAEQLAKASGLLDAVRNRVTDIALVGVVYNTDKLPLTSAAELPGLFEDSIAASKAFEAYIQNDLLEREYLPLGVRPLWGTVTPPYQLMMAKGEGISEISELEGVKLRVAGATGELIAKSLGAVPVKVPASDLYLGLQRGTVNGAVYNPASVFGYKIEEVLSAVSTNASLGAVAFALLVNEDVWQGLTEEQRNTIEEVAADVRLSFTEAFDAGNTKAFDKLAESGVTVFDLPAETQAQMNDMLGAVRDTWVEQVSGRGLPAQEMLDAYQARLAE